MVETTIWHRTLAGAIIGCILGLIAMMTPSIHWVLGGFLAPYLLPEQTLQEILSPDPALYYTPSRMAAGILITFLPLILGCITGTLAGYWLDRKISKRMGKVTAAALLVIGICGIISVPYFYDLTRALEPAGEIGVIPLDTPPDEYYEISEEDLSKYPFFREAIETPGHMVTVWKDMDYAEFAWGSGKPHPWVAKVGDRYYEVYWFMAGDGIGCITIPLIGFFSIILVIMSWMWVVRGRGLRKKTIL